MILPLATASPDDPMTVAFVNTASQLASSGIRLSVQTVIDPIDPTALLELISFTARCGTGEFRLRPSRDPSPLPGSPPAQDNVRQTVEHIQNELFAQQLPVPDIVIGDVCHPKPGYFACGAVTVSEPSLEQLLTALYTQGKRYG